MLTPPLSVPTKRVPLLSTNVVMIVLVLRLPFTLGLLRYILKVCPSYLFSPSDVPIQINPLRSLVIFLTKLCESPVLEVFVLKLIRETWPVEFINPDKMNTPVRKQTEANFLNDLPERKRLKVNLLLMKLNSTFGFEMY